MGVEGRRIALFLPPGSGESFLIGKDDMASLTGAVLFGLVLILSMPSGYALEKCRSLIAIGPRDGWFAGN